MRKLLTLAALLVIAGSTALYAIATITELKLADGRTDENTLSGPVFDPANAPSLSFTDVQGQFDQKEKIVRRAGGGFFTKGPEYNLGPGVDLAKLFGEALRTEAQSMGFKVADDGPAWKIDVVIKDIYLESKQIPYGSTLFYGVMDLEVTTASGSGAPQKHALRVHHYAGGYNAGFGRKDEASASLAQMLVYGAQDVLGRLNRRAFKAAPHSRIAGLDGATVRGADLRAFGLAAGEGGAKVLVDRLPKEDDEDRRSSVLDALALLASPSAGAPLIARLGSEEDEDCRWYTVKALDYIGTDDARAAVESKGLKDEEASVSRLSARVMGRKGK